MSRILSNQNVSVETDLDRVIFSVGMTVFPIPYAVSFKIASNITLACKQVMREIGESLSNIDKHTESDFQIKIGEVSPMKKNLPVERFEWRVEYAGEMVYLWLGNNEVGLHFTDALKVSQCIRLGGAKAKRWAGDSSKSVNAVGILTDAEENYKRGYE